MAAILKVIPYLVAALLSPPFCEQAIGALSDVRLEGEVRAAFLYNFTKFVEWPAEASDRVTSDFAVCVLGRSPFGEALDILLAKSVRGRRIAVTYLHRIEELKECNILFISSSERIRLRHIVAAVEARPILTVSDIKRSVAAGTMIGFVPAGDTVKFEINLRAAQRAGLRISSHLLKLATAVAE